MERLLSEYPFYWLAVSWLIVFWAIVTFFKGAKK